MLPLAVIGRSFRQVMRELLGEVTPINAPNTAHPRNMCYPVGKDYEPIQCIGRSKPRLALDDHAVCASGRSRSEMILPAMADVFRFPTTPPPAPPKNDHRATFFTVIGPSQRPLTCAAFRRRQRP